MQKIITVSLLIVAIIHLLPVSGILGADRLSVLYGLSFDEPNISILMRHRAVLFGVLGLFFIYAAFKSQYQPLAFIAGFISTLSFVVIAWLTSGFNEALHRVVIADLIAILCLLVASMFYFISRRRKGH